MKFEKLTINIEDVQSPDHTFFVKALVTLGKLPIYHEMYSQISVSDPFYGSLQNLEDGRYEGISAFNLYVMWHALEELNVDLHCPPGLVVKIQSSDSNLLQAFDDVAGYWNTKVDLLADTKSTYRFKKKWNGDFVRKLASDHPFLNFKLKTVLIEKSHPKDWILENE